jgi:hypothetical protein
MGSTHVLPIFTIRAEYWPSIVGISSSIGTRLRGQRRPIDPIGASQVTAIVPWEAAFYALCPSGCDLAATSPTI